MAVQPVRHRFSVEEYHRMAEAGVFGEDDRIELLDGEIVEMAAIGSHHAGCMNRLNRLFVEGARGRATVAIQNPVIMSPSSEPEPDVALLRPREDDYTEGHPTPEDVLLLVEVADTTVAFDRGLKIPLYAAAGIAEVWLVDLPSRAVEVHTEPGRGRYQTVRVAMPGETLAPMSLRDVEVAVADIVR